MKRISAIALMLFIFVYAFGSSAQAAPELEYADASIRSTIEADLRAQYVSSLNTEKEYFNTSGDFNNVRLGEGIAVYQIGLEDLSFEFRGYEFPMIINDESVGTIEAEQLENKWMITNISSLAELPSEIEQAQQQAGTDGTLQYIHDKRYKTRGFHIHNGQTEVFLNANNDQLYNMDTFNEVFETYKSDRSNLQMRDSQDPRAIQVGDSGPEFPDSSAQGIRIPLILATIATVLLGVGLILLYKVRRVKS